MVVKKVDCPVCGESNYRMTQTLKDGSRRDITTCSNCDYSIGKAKPLKEESPKVCPCCSRPL